MLLSVLERFYVNSWVRHAVQRPLELAILNHLHPFPTQAHWLDVGCGNGCALIALARRTRPLGLTGVDADEGQVHRARRNLKRARVKALVQVADATQLPLPAQTYDAVTGFGVIHHLEQWQRGVAEIARVLRHGGVYYGLEFYAPLLKNRLFRKAFPHPPHRFTHAQLCKALKASGLEVRADRHFFGCVGFVVAQRIAGTDYD